jgi:hypothetical protein
MTFREYSDRVVSDEAAMEAWATRFDATDAIMQLPEHMRAGLARWVLWAIPPGHFLRAVISNDLYGAVKAADGTNLPKLHLWGLAMLNIVPAACIRQEQGGLVDGVAFWTARGGLLGRCHKCGSPFDVPGDMDTVRCEGTALGTVCLHCASEIAESKFEAQMMEAGDGE